MSPHVGEEVVSSYCRGWLPVDPIVVLCGYDETLLWTRRLILEKAGLSTCGVMKVEELREVRGTVLILCYTLSIQDKERAIRLFHLHYPSARILLLGNDGQDPRGDTLESFNDYHSPERFLEKVCQLSKQQCHNLKKPDTQALH